jgi:MFS family permease
MSVGTAESATSTSIVNNAIYRKVTLRILPILILAYMFSYIDRVNVGFAKLAMSVNLGFSETAFGLGAGVFFLGFFLFQVPSNMAVQKFGARRLLSLMVLSWAVIAPLTAAVQTAEQFYLIRFLLGIAESGFYAGCTLYLISWFPSARRGRALALFATAVPLGGFLGGPMSGWIMSAADGFFNLHGWQWLYILEGLPAVFIALLVFVLLTDRISEAKWLTSGEKQFLTDQLAADEAKKAGQPRKSSLASVLKNGWVWALTGIYFCMVAGFYTVGFWLPTLISGIGVEGMLAVGLLSAIPYAAAIVVMNVVSASSDRHRERRWHLTILTLMCAVGMSLSAVFAGNPLLSMIFLTIGAAGGLSTLPLFWNLPTAILSSAVVGVAIAVINSVGNLAGFFAPYLMGFLSDATGSTATGLYLLGGVMLVGTAAIFAIPARLTNR